MKMNGDSVAAALASFPRPFRTVEVLGDAMRCLMAEGLADLPLPGSGRTLERWRALAAVGAIDLSLAKIYEGHTDALAILAELKAEAAPGLWAVWAAEPPNGRVVFQRAENGRGYLIGTKRWCSGAAVVDHAVLSAWTESGEPILAQVALRQAAATVEQVGWEAVGMAASQSVAVHFDRAEATAVGGAGDYVARPGFWQGGAGIAAVWYGAAVAIARVLGGSSKVATDPHAAAHLGAVDCALRSARALMVETASWIDAHPQDDAAVPALRLRSVVEAAATEVMLRTGRALGPGPLCGNAEHAQRCADLPVFLRQNHAEHDLVAVGRGLGGVVMEWEL